MCKLPLDEGLVRHYACLDETVAEALPSEFPEDGYQEVLTYLLVKALKTFRSILMLARAGLGEDAAVLLRSLFETALVVKWLEQNSVKGPLRFHAWLAKEEIENAEALGDPAPEPARLFWERHRALFTFQDRNGQERRVKRWYYSRTIQSVDALARSVEAHVHYEDAYPILSAHGHCNPSGLVDLVRRLRGDAPSDYLVASERLTRKLLIMAHQYFYIVLATWNETLRAITPETLEACQLNAQAYFQEIRA